MTGFVSNNEVEMIKILFVYNQRKLILKNVGTRQ
jgi:hypothetical protein